MEGAALVWAMLISFVMITSSFVLASLGRSSHDMAQVHLGQSRAQALAQAATEHAVAQVEAALDTGTEPPAEGQVVIDGVSVDYTITRTAAPTVVEDPSGLSSFVSIYRIEALAVADGRQERTRRLVQGVQTPLFQFAMFWENDLEFYHPAEMEITGPVHTNARLMIKTFRDLSFNTNYVGAVGGYYGYDPRTNTPAAAWYYTDPEVRRWVADPTDPSEVEEYARLYSKKTFDAWGIPSASGFDSDFGGHDGDGDGDMYESGDYLPFGPGASEYTSEPDFYAGSGDGSTLQTAEHGLGQVIVPGVDSLAMFVEEAGGDHAWNSGSGAYEQVAAGTGTHNKGPYHQAADLSILSYEDGSWRAFTRSGMDVTADLVDSVESSSVYDARQAEGSGQSVQVTSIDVEALGKSGHFPANGILFAGGHGAGSGADALGFELHNGQVLAGDLTVITPNSLYVRGHYNKDAKKSAAVIADAVNLLSSAWDNSKGPGDLPAAEETTYNMSVVTGDVEEVGLQTQGAAMNALRRHEDWTGDVETVRGSIACLFRSKYATGDFGLGGDFYRPPKRRWEFDEDLTDIANMPPSTPMSVEVTDVVAW